MHTSLPHHHAQAIFKYSRTLVFLVLISFFTTSARATCNAAWTYTISGDTVFLQSADTFSANHHYWSFNGVYNTSNQTSLIHVYTGPGTYHICQYVYTPGTSCSDSSCVNITIPASTPPCTLNTAWTYAIHGDSIVVTASDTSTVNHHYWTASGTTATYSTLRATFVFPNYGTYRICLHEYTVGTNCVDSNCQSITLAAPCSVHASWQSYSIGDTTHFFASGNTGTVYYNWHYGDGQTGTGASPLHVYAQSGTYQVCLYAYTGSNCIDSLCQNVTVTYQVPCHITAAWTSHSHGDTVYFSAADTNAATHHFWNFGDGSAIGTGSTATHTYANAGTYHVCFYDYIPNTTCIDSFCQNVSVTVQVCHVSAAWTYTIHGDTVFLHSTDTISTNNHYWTFGSGTTYTSGINVIHVYPNYGINHICLHVYTPGTTCVDSSCNNITIPYPCALNTAWTFSSSGDTVRFHSIDTSSSVHHYWTFGDGAAATAGNNPLHIYTAAGTYHVCLHAYIPGSACADSFCSTITVGTTCHVSAVWQSSTHGDTTHFYSGSNTGTVYYSWHFGDGTVGTVANPTHVYAQAGTYRVCLSVYSNTYCIDSFCNTVTVGAGCHVSAAWTYTLHGDTVILHSADTASANHHNWVFDGSTSNYATGTTVTHIFTTAGIHHICLYVYTPGTSCIDSSCNNITIINLCNVHAAWQSYTLGDTTHFYASGNTGTGVYYNWNYGDGHTGTGSAPTHVYTQAGTYHVCLYAYSAANCIDSFCNTITIGTGCHVSAAWSYTIHGDTVFLHSSDTSSVNHHYWLFNGNTSTYTSGTNVTHIYTGPGTYHICLYVYTPGTTCSDSSCNNITITNPCHISAAWQSYTAGDTTHFYAGGNTGTVYYNWNYGDGQTGTGSASTHVYVHAGTYHVCLYAYSGTNCIDSFCNTVIIGSGCHVSAAWTYTVHGDTVYLQSTDTSSANHHYWVFAGNPNYVSGTSVTHVYTGPGTYHICLYVYTPGTTCSDSSCNNITISTTCTVHAAWQSYSVGDTTHFYAGTNSSNIVYTWNFGDGHTGTGYNPLHTYSQPGTYYVCLRVVQSSTGCRDSFCNTITVGTGCHISAAWSYALHGDTVILESADTAAANHHFWVFDGSTANYANGTHVTHVFTTTGIHHICLYVYTPGTTCSDSSCNNITIVNPCTANAAWTSHDHGDTLFFAAADTNAAVYMDWNFGDGTYGYGQYPTHVYSQPGTYHVCLYAYNSATCVDSFCNTITVSSGCHISAAWTYTLHGDTIVLQSTDTALANHHYWVFDGSTSNYASGTSITHIFTTTGVHHICLFVYTPGTSCVDSSCNNITIVSPCNVNAAWQSYSIGDTSHFYAGGNTTGTVYYNWNFGDGHTGTGNNPLHVYTQAGTYYICLYAYTGSNCIDSFCNTITIASGCQISSQWTYAAFGDSLHFVSADTNHAAHHYWNFGDGHTGSGFDISHVYNAPGVYHVCSYVYIPGTNCIDSTCNDVIVTGTCGVTAAMNFINIAHDTVAFYSLFQDSAANVVWIYGDGTTGSGAYSVHGYPAPGTYNVCVHVFIPGTPCSDSVCIQINVGTSCAVTAEWASISRGYDSLQFYALDPDTNTVHHWNFGDGTTASGSYAAHTFPTSGTYHVCLYVYVPNTTCSDSLCKDINSVLGITDPGIYPTISLSPNPFSQYAVMNIDGPASTYEVRIYDMLGQQVRTVVGVNKSIMIDRGNLSSGIYTYAVMTGNILIGKGKMSIE